MGKWVIALMAAGVALVAASASAQVVLAPTVFATHGLPSNAITSFTVTCPPGFVAVGAGVSSPAPGTTLLSIRPVGLRAYVFRIGNPVNNRAQRVTVAVACRKLRLGGPVLRVRPVKLKLVVNPGAQRTASLRCPQDTTPAGAGTDIQPQRGKAAGGFAGNPLSVRTLTASLRGFAVTIRNSGHARRSAVLYGNCLTVLRPSGSESAPLRVQITTYTHPFRPGLQRVTHSCPSGWFSIGAGYALRSPVLRLEAAAAIDGGARWWVRNTGDGAATALLQLACGRI